MCLCDYIMFLNFTPWKEVCNSEAELLAEMEDNIPNYVFISV